MAEAELILPVHDDVTMNLTAPEALAINADPNWLQARLLLGALARKHGSFLVEVTRKGRIIR